MPKIAPEILALAEECRDRSAGEVRCDHISNPDDSPTGDRWTVSAFGESYSGLVTAEAHTFFTAWRTLLASAGAEWPGLVKLARMRRITLFRTSTGGWTTLTQTVTSQGPLCTDGWPVKVLAIADANETTAAAAAQVAADESLAERGFTRTCTWMGGAPKMDANTYVALIKKA